MIENQAPLQAAARITPNPNSGPIIFHLHDRS